MGAPPRRRKAERTRARLVAGAGQAVARRGLRAVTIDHIVAAAGVSRRTFYQYFRDKDAALLELYSQVVTDLVARIRAAVGAAENPSERLLAGLDAYLDFQQTGGRLIPALQAEAANPGSAFWQVRERTLDSLVTLIGEQTEAAVGMRIDPLVYRGLLLAMEAMVLHMRRGDGPFAPDARARVGAAIKPMFLAVLAAGASMPQEVTPEE